METHCGADSRRIGVGVIGCGGISAVHLHCLSQMNDVRIIAVCDIKPERAQAAADKYASLYTEGIAVYTDYRELLARDDIESVHVLTPHYLHAPMAEAAIAAGKRVLVEKPMATELSDARQMIHDGGDQLSIIFQNRYNGSVRMMRRLLDSGELGAIKSIRASVIWHREAPYYVESGWRGSMATEGGGTLINQSIHTLDLMVYLGGPALRVKGGTTIDYLQGTIDVEESAHAVIEYANGARGLIHCTNSNTIDAPIELEIICENSALLLRGDNLYRITEADIKQIFKPEPVYVAGKAYWGTGHMAEIRDYYDAYKAGTHFWLDGQQAYPAINLVKAIQLSAAENRWVALDNMEFIGKTGPV